MNANTFILLEFIRQTVMGLPGTVEKPCFGTPAFYAGKNLFARLREDEETLVAYTEERNKWMNTDPLTFFITDHYKNYKYVLVNLERVNPDDLRTLLTTAWRKRAGKRLITVFEKSLQ